MSNVATAATSNIPNGLRTKHTALCSDLKDLRPKLWATNCKSFLKLKDQNAAVENIKKAINKIKTKDLTKSQKAKLAKVKAGIKEYEKAKAANQYKAECKTKAQRETKKCKNLATAAGIGKKESPAGTAINKCGNVDTAFNYGCAGADSGSSGNKNPIFQVLFFIVNLVAIGVGIVAVGGVIYGAILYTSAGDNGEQTKKGINIIVNAVLGVILFAFMYAILNFLVPGGLFS